MFKKRKATTETDEQHAVLAGQWQTALAQIQQTKNDVIKQKAKFESNEFRNPQALVEINSMLVRVTHLEERAQKQIAELK